MHFAGTIAAMAPCRNNGVSETPLRAYHTRIACCSLAIQLYSCIAVHKAVLLTVQILHEQPDQDLLFCLPGLRRVNPQSPT